MQVQKKICINYSTKSWDLLVLSLTILHTDKDMKWSFENKDDVPTLRSYATRKMLHPIRM